MHQTDGTITIFTYKDGLLSRLGHDLQLRLARFELHTDVDSDPIIRATFDTTSIVVEGAVESGVLNPNQPKKRDMAQIERTIRKQILLCNRYPTATYQAKWRPPTSDTTPGRLEGTLTLCGQTQPVSIAVTATEGDYLGRVSLVPTRWGIAPYKALMGALKLTDRVDVAFRLPMAGDQVNTERG